MGWETIRSVLPEDHICHFAKCNICFDFIKDPIECKSCQHHFCRLCIDNWKKRKAYCPNQCPSAVYKEGHRLIKSIIAEILLYCKNKAHGCPSTCKIKDIQYHEQICRYYPLKCPYQGCGKQVAAVMLKKHKSVCEHWKWSCPRTCGFETSDRNAPELHDCDKHSQMTMEMYQEREKKLKEENKMGTDQYFEFLQEFWKFKLQMKLLEVRETHIQDEKKNGFKADL